MSNIIKDRESMPALVALVGLLAAVAAFGIHLADELSGFERNLGAHLALVTKAEAAMQAYDVIVMDPEVITVATHD